MKVLVSYSGGKDSQASLIWAVKKYGVKDIEAVFCDTRWENPITYQHLIDTCKELNVKYVDLRSKKYHGMVDMAKKKGRFASSKARFCTAELKIKPMIDYVLSHNEHLLIIQGIRGDESTVRSEMKKQCTYFKYYFIPYKSNSITIAKYESKQFLSKVQKTALTKAKKRIALGKNDNKYFTYRKKDVKEWVSKYSDDIIRPVFEWTGQEVIDYIIENGQQPNELYKQGFKRVGCFPCFMSSHQEIKQLIKRYPKRYTEIEEIEKDVGSSFFKMDSIPKRFQTGFDEKTGKKFTTAPDLRKYLTDKDLTIDMFEEEAMSCSSFYHLCE